MARARNIKPGLFKNEVLGVADPLYTLLFEGLWVLADREGRLEDRPLRIKAEVFPYREFNADDGLTWLEDNGFIRRYTASGRKCIVILEFAKHQNPHKNESESELPAPDSDHPRKTSEEIGTPPEKIGSPRADSLSSDSGFLIADSGFTDSPLSELSGQPPAEGSPALRKPEARTHRVWAAYSAAYTARYGAEPVRNATVNGQLAQLVKRLGDEAEFVAEFYLSHRNRFYVEKMHPVGLLLNDAEKLRTEWATGRQTTAAAAVQADRTQTNLNAFAPMLAEARKKEQTDVQRQVA